MNYKFYNNENVFLADYNPTSVLIIQIGDYFTFDSIKYQVSEKVFLITEGYFKIIGNIQS